MTGFLVGLESNTFKTLIRKDPSHKKNVNIWQYISLISKHRVMNFIFTERKRAIDFILATQYCMKVDNNKIRITNPRLIAFYINKLKIEKMAQVRHLSVAQCLAIAICKAVLITFPQSTRE